MAREWPTVTIEEITERVAMGPFGSSIKVETFVPDGIPIISGKHLQGTRVNDEVGYNFITVEHASRLRNANVQRGDVVFTHAGNIGQSAYVPQNSKYNRYVISQRQFYLRPDITRVLPEFIVAFFMTPEGRHKLLANASQVGVPSIAQPVTYLRTIELSLPSLSEQRAIAHILGTLDDKIDLNRRRNATLEAMARALFTDWFVAFGPTRAKMEGRTPYLAPDLWDLFPDRLDDEGKPVGWEAGTLDALATLNPESWTARNAPKAVAYVDLANTKQGSIDKVESYAWLDAPSRARRVLRLGDTIVGTVRPGNGSFCYVGEDGLTGSTGFAVLRPKHPRDRAFIWSAATSPENIARLAHLADGGAYPAIRPDAVSATEIAIPCNNMLDAFREIVAEKLALMEANKIESRTLAQTRDLLLPKLMSGEIRLKDAEKTVEAMT